MNKKHIKNIILMKSKEFRLALCALMVIILSALYRPLSCSFDPIERTKQIAQAVKIACYLPYNLTQLYFLQSNPALKAYKQAQHALTVQSFPPAKQTYQELNADPHNPFLMSIGTSMSQTKITENIIHPDYLKKLLQKKSSAHKNPKKWLADRQGYVVRAESQAIPFSPQDEQALIQP